MTAQELIEEDLHDLIEAGELLYADGFEDALIGYVEVKGRPTVALYDRDRCLEVLVERDGMDLAEAAEYLNYNVTDAYVGEHTPAFATLADGESLWKENRKLRDAIYTRHLGGLCSCVMTPEGQVEELCQAVGIVLPEDREVKQ